jgi:uncharacterized LabA/DUF88 family protein
LLEKENTLSLFKIIKNITDRIAKKRVLVIFDGGYVAALSKDRIDINKLVPLANFFAGAKITKALWFTSSHPTGRDIGFLKTMTQAGITPIQYTTKLKGHTCLGCGVHSEKTIQKGVDVGIAIKVMLELKNNTFDTLVFFGGDGDFSELIDIVSLSKNTIVVTKRGSTAKSLVKNASRHIYIDDYLPMCHYEYSDNMEKQKANMSWSQIQKAISA